MIPTRERRECLPTLIAGVGVGALLALTAAASGAVGPAVTMAVALLPFVLAAMTGVAKTTTA